MSGKIMGQVWDLQLSTPKRLVLLAMADHADHEGKNVYPSTALVAWKTGYSERQVRRIVDDLITDNLLVKIEERTGKTTIYKIVIQNGVPKPPLKTNKPLSKRQGSQKITPDIQMSPLPLTNCHAEEGITPDTQMSPDPYLKEPSEEPSLLPAADAAGVTAGESAIIKLPESPEPVKVEVAPKLDHELRPWLYSETPIEGEQFTALPKKDKRTANYVAFCYHGKKWQGTPQEMYQRLFGGIEAKWEVSCRKMLGERLTPRLIADFFALYHEHVPTSETLSDPELVASHLDMFARTGTHPLFKTKSNIVDPKSDPATWNTVLHPTPEQVQQHPLWKRRHSAYVVAFQIATQDLWTVLKMDAQLVLANVLTRWQTSAADRARLIEAGFHDELDRAVRMGA